MVCVYTQENFKDGEPIEDIWEFIQIEDIQILIFS